MTRFLSFTSGSCGNCAYLGYVAEDGTAHGVLIDAGISLRRMNAILRSCNLSYDMIDAVLVTHDHGDHIRHLGSYCKKLSLPVWATTAVHDALSHHFLTRDHISSCRRDFVPGKRNEVAPGIGVRYFVVPHDATETVGFGIEMPDGHRFVLMTDLGYVTPEAMAFAREADTLVIESNYDVDMLMGGDYPHVLKMRIAEGAHLSNDACAEAIRKAWHPGLRNLFLCHLSGNNNTPSLALLSARAALSDAGADAAVQLRILPRSVATPLLTL